MTDEFDDKRPNPRLKAIFMEILDNQLRDSNPKETKETFQRLVMMGIAEQEVRRLLALVIASETFDIMKREEHFNHARFVERLNLLPEMPWMDEEEE